MTLSILLLVVAVCRYAGRRIFYCYAECRYAECRCAECRDAV